MFVNLLNLKALLFIFFCFVFIGTKPYWQDGQHSADGDIDPLRQIFVLLFFFIAIYNSYSFFIKNGFLYYLKKYLGLFILTFIIVISGTWSEHIDFTIRRAFVFVSIFMFIFSAFLILKKDEVLEVLRNSILFVMAINLLSLFFLGGVSYDHEGLFKGIHVHKNTAGAVFSLFILVIFFDNKFNFISKLILSVFGFYLLFISGSKTSIGLLIFSIVLYYIISNALKLPQLYARALKYTCILLGVCFFTYFGIDAIFYSIGDIYGDRSFTGRQNIWDFSISFIEDRPLLGWGFGAFWGVGNDSNNIFFSDGFIENYGQSHNGYLDVLLQIGYLGLIYVSILLLFIFNNSVSCLAKYKKDVHTGFLFSFITFFILHNMLETTLLVPLSVLWPIFIVIYFSLKAYSNE